MGMKLNKKNPHKGRMPSTDQDDPKVTIGFYLDYNLYKRLKNKAQIEDCSVSYLIRQLISEAAKKDSGDESFKYEEDLRRS